MSAQQLEQIEQLQARLSKMELTLEAIADAVVWVGTDEVVQWCNSSFECLVNRPKSEIINFRFSDLLPLWQAGNPVELELYPHTQIHQGNYTPREYEFQQTDYPRLLNISGNFADITSDKSAILVIKDITQQKQESFQIAEYKQIQEALTASEARLNTILNSAQAAIYYNRVYANGEWHFEYCSAGSLKLWGYSPEELIADKNLFMSRMFPEDLETTVKNGFEAVFTEQPCEIEYRYLAQR